MSTFQRARNDEQREVRRRAILDAAAQMLVEMPVASITLNELSRRVGLAKSNVLRYFESREAILLVLLEGEWRLWLEDVHRELDGSVDPGASRPDRGDQVAAALTRSLEPRRVLCDLLGAQDNTLDRNVSAEVAARYKRAAIADIEALAASIHVAMPELDQASAVQLCGITVILAGAVWTRAQPSPGMLAAYDADPELAAMRTQFGPTLNGILRVVIAGLLARAEQHPPRD